MATFLGPSSSLLSRVIGKPEDYDDLYYDEESDYDEYEDSDYEEYKESDYEEYKNESIHDNDKINELIDDNLIKTYNTTECCICLSDLLDESVDNYIQTKCKHYLCTLCLDYYINNQLKKERGFVHKNVYEIIEKNNNTIKIRKAFGIKCPITTCNNVLKLEEDLKPFISKDVKDKLNKKALEELKLFKSKCHSCNTPIQDFTSMFCRNRSCIMKRIYQMGVKQYVGGPQYHKDVLNIKVFKKSYSRSAINYGVETSVKFCPNCTSPIEKNGGCNNMYCNKCDRTFNWEQATTMEEAINYLKKTKNKKVLKIIKKVEKKK